MGCGAPSSRISESAAVSPGTIAPLASVTTTSTTTCSTLARSVGAWGWSRAAGRRASPPSRRQQTRGRGAASRVPGSGPCGARRGRRRALASAASSSVRSLDGGVAAGVSARADCRIRTASARWPSAVSASPRPSAESSVRRWPFGSTSVWTRSASRYSGSAALNWPRPLRMSPSCRYRRQRLRVPRAEQIAAHRHGLAGQRFAFGRSAAVPRAGTRRDCGDRTPRRRAALPRPRGRSGAPPGNGFPLQHSLLVLLDEGQVVEDGGQHRMRLAIDLAGLGHTGVQHRPGLVRALQVAQDQAARRRCRDQVDRRSLDPGPARRKAASPGRTARPPRPSRPSS